MAFLGVGLGAAADAYMSGRKQLQNEKIQDEELQLDKNKDARAQTLADQQAADRAKSDAYYKALAGSTPDVPLPGKGGAPVVNNDPASPTNSDQPVGVKAASPDAAPDGGTGVAAPAATPPSSGSSAKGTGVPTSANAFPAGSESARAWEAYKAVPTAEGYQNFIAARAADRQAAESAARIRMSEIQARAAEHTLTQQDIEDSQKNAAAAASRATGSLEGYGSFSDDVAANDPRVVENTKRVLTDLQNTHSQMADGQVASWKLTPAGVQVDFKDAKTGKQISTQTLGTVGDVRKAVQMTGMATDPLNYPKVMASNTLTMIANKTREAQAAKGVSDASNAAVESELKGRSLDTYKKIADAIQDPTGKPLLDPASAQELKIKATQAAIENPDLITYTKEEPVLDEAGKPVVNERTGVPATRKVQGNRLLDLIEYNTPKQTTQVKDSTGNARTMTIDDAAKVVVDKYPQILKETNHDPNLAAQTIRDSLLKQGFDARTVDWKMPQIMQAGASQQAASLTAAAVPQSVAVKQQPGLGAVGRGVSAVPTRQESRGRGVTVTPVQ